MQAVFQGQFLADTGTAQTLVPVRNGIAVVVYAVEGDMHVRMFLVKVPGDKELRVLNPHPFHVFKCNPCHDTVRQSWLILFGKAQSDMPDRFGYLAVHLRLRIETHSDGFPVFHEQILVCDKLGIFAFVKDVVHHTLEVASLYDFRHHIPILVISS